MSLLKVGSSVIRSTGGGALRRSQSVLQPSDLTFAGYYRVPGATWDMNGGGSFLALRQYAGDTRVFTSAFDGSPTATKRFVEMTLPTSSPSSTISSAPRCTYVADHGNIWANSFGTAGVTEATTANSVNFGGAIWDENLSGFWFTSGDPYGNGANHYPTLSFVAFSGGTRGTVYGPWRSEIHPNRACGNFTAIPSGFSGTYLGGTPFGYAMGSGSGIASRSAGCSLAAFEYIDPYTLAPATAPNPSYNTSNAQFGNQWVFGHDYDHPQTRDNNYRICAWGVDGSGTPGPPYNCVTNNSIITPNTNWGGTGSAGVFTNEDDSIGGVCWIETGSKRGLVYFGQLVTTPAGYATPGSDPNGLVHCWYGDPLHATASGTTGAGYENNKCCHGQSDPFWGATGPGSHYKVPHMWIYDPEELGATASGSADLWTRTPTSVSTFTDEDGNIAFPGAPSNQLRSGYLRSPVFDSNTGRIYAMVMGMDTTTHFGSSSPQPVIAVWNVAA